MFRPGLTRTVKPFTQLRPLTPVRDLSLKSLKPNFSKYKLIEQPVGNIVGGPNDPTPQPEVDYFHGSYHWTYERLIAISLVPLSITPFVTNVDMPILDSLLSSFILIHSHIGFQSCIIDYIPKRVYGFWHKAAMALLTFGTAVGFYGIYTIETMDEGVTNLIKKLWTEPEPQPFYFGRRY
ncbi:CYFA0S01e19790g1_1 [Cyberlindnera fabianii]|uniref:Succinate dehydrogenase [ubiquinone] cytochrome b small subunit n=1 Tax=Cyberlindnera fabianii TaxID=36022 RepID=A0A061ARM9_CYBFA|nr:Succinate dehydrogenase [ubiquinone] cytochrome b small subunit, mitochondrial [Cyberlindnera fabianii]CDR37975.1 CYFA0S01e19790g1_1 [Cyberlindnera fabianii]